MKDAGGTMRKKTSRWSKCSGLLLCIRWSSCKVSDPCIDLRVKHKPLDALILVYMCMCHTCLNLYMLYRVLCVFVICVHGIMLCVHGMVPHIYVCVYVTCLGSGTVYYFCLGGGRIASGFAIILSSAHSRK